MVHFLLALDDQEGLVEYGPVGKEVVFRLLHLNIQKTPRPCSGEDVQDDLLAPSRTHRYCLVEGEGQVLDFVVALQLQNSVQEVLEGVFAVEEFLETSVEPGVNIDLPLQALGNRRTPPIYYINGLDPQNEPKKFVYMCFLQSGNK